MHADSIDKLKEDPIRDNKIEGKLVHKQEWRWNETT